MTLPDAINKKQFDSDLDRILAYGPSKKTKAEPLLTKDKIKKVSERVKRSKEAAEKGSNKRA